MGKFILKLRGAGSRISRSAAKLKPLLRAKLFWPQVGLNSFIRPGLVWPVLILLLFSATVLYVLKEKEKIWRRSTQNILAQVFEAKTLVEDRLKATAKAKEKIEEAFAVEREKSLALERELEERDRQAALALERVEQEMSLRREAEAQLIALMEDKNSLEVRLKELTAIPETVELQTIVIQKSAPPSAGRITSVYRDPGFVVVNLGWKNDLKIGDVLSVYRHEEFIGKLRVEKVKEDMSAAFILPEWQDVEFQENDDVKAI